MAAPNMNGYVEVAERIHDFRNKHPEGSLRPMDPARPYWLEQIDGRTFLVYAAAAYRTPDDTTPGIGLAWEPVPGTTNFTRGSELQNAETSAWGRAIVAVLASDTKRGVASREEVESARASQPARSGGRPASGQAEAQAQGDPSPDPRIGAVVAMVKELDAETRASFKREFGSKPSEIKDLSAAIDWLHRQVEPF